MSNDTSKENNELNIPSEFRLSLKWENAIKRFGYGITIGSVVGAAASIIIFSKSIIYTVIIIEIVMINLFYFVVY
jgi:hypothetical protein